MRIAVIGAGGMGGTIGGRLAALGEDVRFLVRGRHLQAIRQHGLTLRQSGSETWLRSLAVSDDPRDLGKAEAVLVCVKMYDLADALVLASRCLAEGGFLVTIQNGIEAAAMAADAVGGANVVAGVSWLAARIVEPGVIDVAGGMEGRPWLELGEFAGPRADSDRVRQFASLLSLAGVPAAAVERTDVLLWEKFCLISATSSASGLTRQPIGAVRSDPDGRWLIEQAVAETVAVARARGVPLEADAAARTVALIDSMPAAARPSQLVDLEAGKPLELGWLSGAVRRLGADAGMATPYHAVAYAALKPFAPGRPAQP